MSADPQAAIAGRTILVVEDEFGLALELQDLLEAAGGRVEGPFAFLANARAALDRGVAFDAAIVDLRLRDAVSTPLIERLVQRGVPLVVYTGTPDPVAALTEAGAVDVCLKPAPPTQAVSMVAALMA